MSRFETRDAAARGQFLASHALVEFDKENAVLLARRKELEGAVREAQWPPAGHEECSGGDDVEECSAIFPTGHMPEGWRERQFSCGDGGSGAFFCPTHAEQGRESAGRCNFCSN